MTYRSESRGLMYTAPPKEDAHDATDDATGDATEEAESESEERAPELESTAATTDANWTGAVPADD